MEKSALSTPLFIKGQCYPRVEDFQSEMLSLFLRTSVHKCSIQLGSRPLKKRNLCPGIA